MKSARDQETSAPGAQRCACGDGVLHWEVRQGPTNDRLIATCSNRECGRISTQDGREAPANALRTFLIGSATPRANRPPWVRFLDRAARAGLDLRPSTAYQCPACPTQGLILCLCLQNSLADGRYPKPLVCSVCVQCGTTITEHWGMSERTTSIEQPSGWAEPSEGVRALRVALENHEEALLFEQGDPPWQG